MHMYIDVLWKYNFSCMKLRHKGTIISINFTKFITISNYGTYIHLNNQCNHVLLKLNQTNSMNMEMTHNNFNNFIFFTITKFAPMPPLCIYSINNAYYIKFESFFWKIIYLSITRSPYLNHWMNNPTKFDFNDTCKL